MTRIATLLRMLLIVGLAVAPLSVHAAASGARDISHAMDRAAVTMPADSGDMPSDDAAMDCGDMHCPDMHDGKACACFAACATMYALGLPSLAPIAANLPVTSQLMAFSSEEQLASLAAPPPARPPRN